MSIVAYPALGSTATIQAGTPFSYSFTYSDPITADDVPVYSGGGERSGTPNETVITYPSTVTSANITGQIYALQNMSPGNTFEVTLPILPDLFHFSIGSYLRIAYNSSPSCPDISLSGGADTIHYLKWGSLTGYIPYYAADSVEYLVSSPSGGTVSILVKRPSITSATINEGYIDSNTLNVLLLNPGDAIVVGMHFSATGSLTRPFDVTAYIGDSWGGPGTYTIAPTDGNPTPISQGDSSSGFPMTSDSVENGNILLTGGVPLVEGQAQVQIYMVISTETL